MRLDSCLPSIHDLIHSQEQPLHILQQSSPLNIFSMEKDRNIHKASLYRHLKTDLWENNICLE